MRTSTFLVNCNHQYANNEQLLSYNWMNKIGMIADMGEGLYTWLPLGLRVIQKVAMIIRLELASLNAQECLFPIFHSSQLTKAINKVNNVEQLVLNTSSGNDCNYLLSNNAVAIATDMMRRIIRSRKQLPLIVFQIQNQYFNDSNLSDSDLTERVMYDGFSFHMDEASLQKNLAVMQKSLQHIIGLCGLSVQLQEDQACSDSSKTTPKLRIVAQSYSKSSDSGMGSAFEIGHIIQYGTSYADLMHLKVMDQSNHFVSLHTAGYHLSLSKLVTAVIEKHHDDRGIIWPAALAPFQIVMVPLCYHKSYRVREMTDKLYKQLKQLGYEVLLEDRKERPGTLFAKMDLLGIPHRIVIAEKFLDQQVVEYKRRSKTEVVLWPIQDILMLIEQVVKDGDSANSATIELGEIAGA